MDKNDFMKRIALTLELSITMADFWLTRIHPDNEEERTRTQDHRDTLNKLHIEVSTYNQNLRDKLEE